MTLAQIISRVLNAKLSITIAHTVARDPAARKYPYVISDGKRKWYCKDFGRIMDVIDMVEGESDPRQTMSLPYFSLT